MKDYLKRQIWIMSQLYQNPKGLTYKEIEDRWQRSSVNSLGSILPKRTFQDCIKAVEETFDVDIASDARNGYRFRIVERDWLEKDRVKDWLLSSFAVNTMLQDSRGLRERVVYEEIPSGNLHLLPVLKAMRDNNVLHLEYQDYFDAEPRMVILHAYLVRAFKRRWYVLGKMVNSPEGEEPAELTSQGDIRRYALDRIVYLELTNEKFAMPSQFDASSYFDDAFGIIVEPGEYDVETIKLKAYDINHRREYLRSLPLHKSQKETEKAQDYSVFELQLAPTYDFIQELLSMGGEVEVLSPDYVRQEMKRRVSEMYSRYNRK